MKLPQQVRSQMEFGNEGRDAERKLARSVRRPAHMDDVGDDLARDPVLVVEMDRLVPLLSKKLRE